jgi:hypothetical protein
MKRIIYIALIALSVLTACHNQDWEFPDYEYTTVYFPYQSPVRTIVLGEDIYDNTLDKAHKCKIMATMGGVYANKVDRILTVAVDNSLCDNLKFDSDSGDIVLPLPAEYYSLASDMKIIIPSGSESGGIEVQLTDAFFADPKSITNTYVIPLRITSVENADSILSGLGAVQNPDPRIVDDWQTVPKNYILYGVKYINPWHGSYLRRGVAVTKGNQGKTDLDETIVYRKEYVEKDQVVSMKTVSMKEVSLPLITREKGSETDIPFELRLIFDDNGKCAITSPIDALYSVVGSGQFVSKGDMWGNIERDVIHIQYTLNLPNTTQTFSDTIVMRDRGVVFETFTPFVDIQ